MARYAVVTGTVLAEALRIGAERDYVIDVIRRFRIAPPADAPETWPWPVRIHALGRFEIECDGQTLEFSNKAPRRVLAVLKAIVAGGGKPVPSARLVDALWPDDEGDAGRKALDVCLVRCASSWGTPTRYWCATISRANRELCWVDAWAFDTWSRSKPVMKTRGHRRDSAPMRWSFIGETFFPATKRIGPSSLRA
jgi:hypothetical protein